MARGVIKKAELLKRGKWPPAPMVAVFDCWRCGSKLRARMADCEPWSIANDDSTRYCIACPVCGEQASAKAEQFRPDDGDQGQA